MFQYIFFSVIMKLQKLKYYKNTTCNSAPTTIFCVVGGKSICNEEKCNKSVNVNKIVK